MTDLPAPAFGLGDALFCPNPVPIDSNGVLFLASSKAREQYSRDLVSIAHLPADHRTYQWS